MAGMAEFILHHYASSPFSEKVRLAFGLKGLAWRSVEVAAVPPRPLLDALTGGYRRVPVLQVGADVYCDSNLILPALERLAGGPTLYPEAPALSQALGFNWERSIWLAAIGVRVHAAKEDAPAGFLRDREKEYLYVDMSKAAMEPLAALNVQRVRAQLAFVDAALADGRAFLSGGRPGALDLVYAHIVWLMRGADEAKVDALLNLAPILPWLRRVLALGHGRPAAMGAEEALAAARATEPAAIDHLRSTLNGEGPRIGSAVTVTPDDFARVPVAGTLVGADEREVVIHRRDECAGNLHLHFPRAGFEMRAA